MKKCCDSFVTPSNLTIDGCARCGHKYKTHMDLSLASAAVTQAERAVLDLVKEWKAAKQAAELLADDPHAWHLWNENVENRLVDAQDALEAAERERDALNASTVPVGDGV